MPIDDDKGEVTQSGDVTLKLPFIPFTRHGAIEILEFRFDMPALGKVLQQMALDLSTGVPDIVPLCQEVLSGFQHVLAAVTRREHAPLDQLIERIYELVDHPPAMKAIRERYQLDWQVQIRWENRMLPQIDGLRVRLTGDIVLCDKYKYWLSATALLPSLILTACVMTMPDGEQVNLLAA